MRSSAAVLVFLAVAGWGLAADLISKHEVFRRLLRDPAVEEQVGRRVREYPAGSLTTEDMLHDLRAAGLLQCRVLPGVRFSLSTNPGVVFGWRLPPWAVLAATALTLVVVGWLFAMADARARVLHVAMSLILAGALGNLYDRLWARVSLPGLSAEPILGQVRDFIDCSELYYPYVFNVADVWLVVGVGLLLIRGWAGSRGGGGKANR